MLRKFLMLSFIPIFIFMFLLPIKGEEEFLNVYASHYNNLGTGSMSCPSKYYGSIETTIEFREHFQTYSKTLSTSDKGGTYHYIRPDFGNIIRIRAKGSYRSSNGTLHIKYTNWNY